ncbi:hypothetical protein BDR03DRAFT_966633 [Suillus americanus]|nr:hypothetical protein BDR03DRAFT_966633 [Suillus americanus]
MHVRHRDFLEQAVIHLEEFLAFLGTADSEPLRYATRAIGSISGLDVGVEEVSAEYYSARFSLANDCRSYVILLSMHDVL